MLIRPVPSCGHTWPTLSPGKSSLQPVGPSSCTRHGWFRIAPIDQYSLLLPPVGVWTVSQFQCGGPVLSEPLPIVGLVGRHPANCLMGRVPILHRVAPLAALGCPSAASWNISASFPAFCSCAGQVAHVLRTRTPLVIAVLLRHVTVRLACIKPAASVHPEPGSNSPLYVILSFSFCLFRASSDCSQKHIFGMFAADLHLFKELPPGSALRPAVRECKSRTFHNTDRALA